MNSKVMFETQNDYTVPLLRLLAEMPRGEGRVAEVLRRFEQKYRSQIPPDHYEELKSGREVRWENYVQWSRNNLKNLGFLDPSIYGVWRITEAGGDWLRDNPTTTRLLARGSGSRHATAPGRKSKVTLAELENYRRTMPEEDFLRQWGGLYDSLLAKSQQAKTGGTTRSGAIVSAIPGITFEMLENTKKAMPADEFRRIWGILYDQLLAEERAKAISEITDAELGQQARQKLDKIHSFLRGQNTDPPKSDIICDWIHLCYELDLNREAASLWQYVREEEVEPVYYRRAKRWAEAGRVKLGW
jgi:hypothetical protein